MKIVVQRGAAMQTIVREADADDDDDDDTVDCIEITDEQWLEFSRVAAQYQSFIDRFERARMAMRAAEADQLREAELLVARLRAKLKVQAPTPPTPRARQPIDDTDAGQGISYGAEEGATAASFVAELAALRVHTTEKRRKLRLA